MHAISDLVFQQNSNGHNNDLKKSVSFQFYLNMQFFNNYIVYCINLDVLTQRFKSRIAALKSNDFIEFFDNN